MSSEQYHVPLPLLKEFARDYNKLMRVRVVVDHSNENAKVEEFLDEYSKSFDVLVSDMLHLQDKITMVDLILWLYPALKKGFIDFDVLDNAIAYSLVKLGLDGPLDLPLLKSMFTHAKNARSVKELEYALVPEELLDVPLSKWSDEMFDGFYSSLLFDEEE